jgi:DNA repair exonuclease SbcCD ATPase subunit
LAVEREREGDRPAEREREGDRPGGEEREAHTTSAAPWRSSVREREGDRPAEREREGDRPGGEEREAHLREMAQRRAQLMEQAGDIRRKLESLRPDQDDDARELRSALERIEVQLRELQAPAPGRERLLARLEEVKAAFRRAQEAGRADEAERLEREGRELMQMLDSGPETDRLANRETKMLSAACSTCAPRSRICVPPVCTRRPRRWRARANG